jgi:hypothetical protein
MIMSKCSSRVFAVCGRVGFVELGSMFDTGLEADGCRASRDIDQQLFLLMRAQQHG